VSGELVEPTEQIGQNIVLSRYTLLSRILRFGMGDRNSEWEQYLPAPYVPLAQYEGPVTKRTYPYGASVTLTKDALDHDQSFMNFLLTPRSDRITYALDLMRALLTEIKHIVSQQGGRFMLHTAGPHDDLAIDLQGQEVFEVKGKYYMISSEQGRANLEYITSGFEFYHSPVTLEAWAVGPEDGHFNEHAVDEAMARLAERIVPLLPAQDR